MDTGKTSATAPPPKSNNTGRRHRARHLWITAAVLVVGAVLVFALARPAASEHVATFSVRRGNLPIKVLQGGTVKAMRSQQIRSEIKGMQGTKILSIVEEGYLVTEEDVKQGKVLVELDSSELVQRVTTQEIQVQATRAALIEAQQSFEIQVIQNQSDLKAAEQKARFAYLDFSKYMGGDLAHEITAKASLNLESVLTNQPVLPTLNEAPAPSPTPNWAASASNGPSSAPGAEGRRRGAGRDAEGGQRLQLSGGFSAEGGRTGDLSGESGDGQFDSSGGKRRRVPGPGGAGVGEGRVRPPSTGAEIPPVASSAAEASNAAITAALQEEQRPRVRIDFEKYLQSGAVGDGDAQQKLRELEDALLVARAERELATNKLSGTKQLFDKGFVTQSDYDRDKVSYDKSDLSVKKSETALALFKTYDFPKQAEQFLSAFEEGLRLLTRTQKEAISKLAQADAKLRAAQSRFRLEQEQLADWKGQLGKCALRATTPGLVVYANGNSYRGPQEPIQEGATVRERQEILTIPDMSQMAVEIKVHESHIQRIIKGLPALIRVEAFPDEVLTGEVNKVALVPDSQDRWMNPDLKVYPTTISATGSYEWLKPGMSAQVEILVKELTNVVYVPLQAVSYNKGDRVCYVDRAGQTERRVVQTGEFSDQFIEIKEGLTEGETVLLLAPKHGEPSSAPATDKKSKTQESTT